MIHRWVLYFLSISILFAIPQSNLFAFEVQNEENLSDSLQINLVSYSEKSTGFIPTNPINLPLVRETDIHYKILPKGLEEGVTPYTDRKYKLDRVPDILAGLTLLQTSMGHKGIDDDRFSIVLSTNIPCTVFLAVDERMLLTWESAGAMPEWVNNYRSTNYLIYTDEPIMGSGNYGYAIFSKEITEGEFIFGPPHGDPNVNAMYFAFFVDVKKSKEILSAAPLPKPPVDIEQTTESQSVPNWPFVTGVAVFGIGILLCMIPLFLRRERLGGILISPRSTFQEIAEQPDWVGPFFIVLVPSLVLSVATIAMIFSGPGPPPAGMPGAMLIVIGLAIAIGVTLFLLIVSYCSWLVGTGLIWIFARISGERARFYPLLSAVGYANLPQMLLGGIAFACFLVLGTVQVMGPGDMPTMPTSLAGLLPNLAEGPSPG